MPSYSKSQMTIPVLASGVAGYYPKRADVMPRTNAGWWDIHWQAAGARRGWGIIWRRTQLELLPPAPKVCPGKGLAPTPCHFAFSLPSPKQNQCLTGKETNQHIKYWFLKKMPLSMDSTQLAEPASSVPQAFGQPSFGALPEKQWKCVSTLAFTEQWGSVGLANTNSCWDPRRAAARPSASPQPTLPTSATDPATPVLPLAHSCLAPTHVWLEESNWHFIQHWTMLFPLLSKPSCFSANLALQCILIMAPIQINFLLHIDEFHLLGSPTNPGRETTDVQWAQGPGSWVLDSLHCVNTTLAFPPFMNVCMLRRL